MKTIIISPYSRGLRSGKENPKNYPYWNDVVSGLRLNSVKIIQIGVGNEKSINADIYLNNLPLDALFDKVKEIDTWASCDNFFPHMCNLIKKRGVVIWGRSDPKLFGYNQNINLLKDKKYLRDKQFDIWEAIEFNSDVFVEPEIVVSSILSLL